MEIRVFKCHNYFENTNLITAIEARNVVGALLPRVAAIDGEFFHPFVEQFRAGTVPLHISSLDAFTPFNWGAEPDTSIFEVVKPQSHGGTYRVFFVIHPCHFLQYRRAYVGEQNDKTDSHAKPLAKIFISYTTRDENYKKISSMLDDYLWGVWQQLQVWGVDIFYACFSLPRIVYREQDLEKILHQAVRSSWLFTAFITRQYAGSAWCRFEWDTAMTPEPLPITLSYVLTTREILYGDADERAHPADEESQEYHIAAATFLDKVRFSLPETCLLDVSEADMESIIRCVRHTIAAMNRNGLLHEDSQR